MDLSVGTCEYNINFSFFFSSRRRHTRLQGDWSSDVCSSDLPIEVATKGTPMVDWRALQHWQIQENRLPANAVVRYRPETLWDEHKKIILISLGDRKSTRLNSSHPVKSHAGFCL